MEIFASYSQIDTGTSSKSRLVKSGIHDDKKKRCINGIYPPPRDPGSAAGPDRACCTGSVGDSEVLRLLISCHCDSQRRPLALALPAYSRGRPGAARRIKNHDVCINKKMFL